MLKTTIQRLFKSGASQSDTHNFNFDYSIRRSERKTLSIKIEHGAVKVMAPKQYPQAQILEFLVEKQLWIDAKLQRQQQLNAQLEHVKSAAQFFSFGELKKLESYSAAHFSLTETEQSIIMTIPTRVSLTTQRSYVKKQLSAWYKKRAEQYLPQRLALISEKSGLFPSQLIIKQYKARWGSCNTQGVINLNSLLMMTPEFVIDYVIVHELCHLKHMNHSPKFWALVEHKYPQYNRAKAWLKVNKIQLHAFHL